MTVADPSFVPGAARGGLREWVWRKRALESARSRTAGSWQTREYLRRARLAAEVAERSLDAVEPLQAGPPHALVISLYREAAYWALLAPSAAGPASGSMAEAFERADLRELERALGAGDFAAARTVLLDQTFIDTASHSPAQLARETELVQRFVHTLLESESDRVGALLAQRWLRTLSLLLLAAAAASAALLGIKRAAEGPDLLLGKPWRASSQLFLCHPEANECGGARSAMFFHTREENAPWVEFDFGRPQSFAHLRVENREDCCLERVAPLVVEISDDRVHYRAIARAPEPFHTWDARFPSVKARYVRLRVERRSILHLVRVSAFAR